MASLPNDEVVRRWAFGLVRTGEVKRVAGGTVYIRESGAIEYVRRHKMRAPWGPVILGRYLAKQKTILLNGDGFTDGSATDWQSRLRVNVANALAQHPDAGFVDHVAVIPYAALAAAEIEIDSILPIDVVQDTNIEVWHRVDFDESSIPLDPEWAKGSTDSNRWFNFQGTEGTWIRVTEMGGMGYVNSATGATTITRPASYSAYTTSSSWSYTRLPATRQNATWAISGVTPSVNSNVLSGNNVVLFKLDATTRVNRAAERQRQNDRVANGQWGAIVTGEIPTEDGWYWTEVVHHLGSSLFSARDYTSKRHKFLSAFDEEEANTMYFLAQLPDKSGAVTYEQALLALAPPFVHAARLEGREIRRQGDVFAVATTLTDEEVYGLAKRRVRRDIALRDLSRLTWGNPEQLKNNWPEPLPEEVREKIWCPCGCGHKRWYGCGPKAKKTLSIYNTGHTATEVVVTEKGVTYIRGTMHHDPYLTEPGRRAEHADVTLRSGVWYVCCRNTVPRRPTRTNAVASANENAEAVTATTA